MAERTLPLTFNDAEISIVTRGSIKREALYGKQTKVIEKDGQPLEQMILDPEGNIFRSSDITHIPTDSNGSITEKPIIQTPDGERLDPKPSSYKEARPLEKASISDLAQLRAESIIPVETTLDVGLYKTQYAYNDSPVLKDAILNVTPNGAFLLVGISVDVPLQGKADVYDFFEVENDSETDSDDDEDDISFDMF